MSEITKQILVITSFPNSIVGKRQNTNQPELRHQLIYNKLSKNSNIFIVKPNYDLSKNYSVLFNIHNKKLIEFLANCYASWTRYGNNDSNFVKNDGIVPYNITKFNYHSLDNVTNLLNKLPYFRQCGLWCDDSLTPIFEDTWHNALASANNSLTVKDYINDHDVIYCLNQQPGHHAKYESYGGYCFLNNAAIIAKTLQFYLKTDKKFAFIPYQDITYKKIAILDIDYHAGNGTSDIFRKSENVLTISIHANPAFDYPFYESYEVENTETNINIVFEPNTDINIYMTLLEKALYHIDTFNPDCLIIPFGGDTFKNDPDASPTCRCELEISDYKCISKRIREVYKKKIIICQEGGYDMENISEIVSTFLDGFV